MYTVTCDGYPLLDFRDENLILFNPKVKLEVNTVGEGSFTIYKKHPYYDKIKRLKSVIEVRDEIGVIFRGRMTDDTIDFNNGKAVDLEGLMAFFNDSVVAPYNFPNDFLGDSEYIAATESGNVIEFFLKWLIDNHNSQVSPQQQFKLGVVTVKDPNNYLARSDSEIQHTWDVLKAKLFDSALGGYLCIRYEEDGNYIDYLSEFELTNTQEIEFGENLVDLKRETKGSETYTAIIPIGAEIEIEVEVTPEPETVSEDTGETEGEGEGEETEPEVTTKTIKKKITLEDVVDGNITDDIVKTTLSNGLHAIYSISAVEEYGWICPKPSETTWDDVTLVENLVKKAVDYLQGTAVMLSDTIEITAVDLHFTDKDIQSFRIYRNVKATSTPHGLSKTYPLTKLEIPLLEPQNTKITLGETVKTLTVQNNQKEMETIERIQSAEKDIEANRTGVTETKEQLITQSTSLINSCESIIFGALESYVETGNYEEFKQTTEAQLKLIKDEFSVKLSEVTEQVNNVDGDLQAKFNEITAIFSVTIDGVTFGRVESPYKIFFDDNEFSMMLHDQKILWFELSANSHEANIPELIVTKKFMLFGYLIDMDDDGRVNCEYVGG